MNFNPRSLTGATTKHIDEINDILFQSTLPHGSDARHAVRLSSYRNFNPRSLTGATNICPILFLETCNFNPRSLTGATANVFSTSGGDLKFQSTLPHGSDARLSTAHRLHKYFNPRSLTGATRAPTLAPAADTNFNPRSLTGATAKYLTALYTCYDFNPRSLTGATQS